MVDQIFHKYLFSMQVGNKQWDDKKQKILKKHQKITIEKSL